MKASAGNIASAGLIVLILLALGFVLALTRHDSKDDTCGGIDVEIVEDWHFVEPEDVKCWVETEYGHYLGQKMDSLDLAGIENMLDTKSAVLKSQVWVTEDGILHVSITQREPVVRFQTPEGGFYMDDRSCIFPLQHGYTARVPVIDGYLPLKVREGYKGEVSDPDQKEWADRVLQLVNHMKASGVWDKNISQINVRENGDILMVPRSGREIFIFGKLEDIQDKFSRMEKYYTHIAPSKEKGYYGSVNLKYKGQIICRK